VINREWGRRLIKIQCNVRERDVASFVQEARHRIESEIELPEGYVIEWGGQFEHLERSKIRFMIVVPITLMLIFIMLYFSLKDLNDVLIIYTGIPFAFIGGVFALWSRDMPFSVSAAIGFIALSGIAVLNGQVLVSTINNLRKERRITIKRCCFDGSRTAFNTGDGNRHYRCSGVHTNGHFNRSRSRSPTPPRHCRNRRRNHLHHPDPVYPSDIISYYGEAKSCLMPSIINIVLSLNYVSFVSYN